jgi:hypothetical protein
MLSKGHGSKWPRLYRKAAKALALAMLEGRPFAVAAAAVGIHRATLFRWVKLPGFHAAVEVERQRFLKGAIYASLQGPSRGSAWTRSAA